MLDKGIDETDQTPTPLFEEGRRIGCEVGSVNFAQLVNFNADASDARTYLLHVSEGEEVFV